jgi:hypothetical protein
MISLLGLAVVAPPAAHFINAEHILSRPKEQNTVAGRLAEAGLKRGMAKLQESEIVWQRARVGTAVPHYNDDLNYSDYAGGFYRIRFVPGPTSRDVTVLTTGLDTTSGDTRALQAVFTKDGLPSALQTEGDMALGPSVHVHWGPVVARGNLLLGNTDGFPRKFAQGRVVYWNDRENGAGNRRSNDKTLGDAPRLDLAYYRDRARKTAIPLVPDSGGRVEWNGEGSWPALASPSSSGHFLASANSGQGIRFQASPDGRRYSLSDPTAVILIENDTPEPIETRLSSRGAFLEVEAFILTGPENHLRLEGQSGELRSVLPAGAQREYGPDSQETWEKFAPLTAQPGRCCLTIENAAIRGLVWVEGDLLKHDEGAAAILGTVRVGGTLEARGLSIYYDDAVALNVRLEGKRLVRADWSEVPAHW